LAETLGTKVPVVIADGRRFDLCSRGAVLKLFETMFSFERRIGIETPAIVAFDTLAALTPGADEISGADMTAAMHAIRSVTDRFLVHSVVVHHTPLDNPQRSRGHSSIEGAGDLVIGIDKGKIGSHRWRVLRANSIADPGVHFGEYSIGSYSLGGASVAIVKEANLIAELPERDAAVLAILKAATGSPIVFADLTRAAAAHSAFAGLDGDAPRKATDRSLRALADAGLAIVEGEGKGRTARAVETQP
jgi:hypothetical protein